MLEQKIVQAKQYIGVFTCFDNGLFLDMLVSSGFIDKKAV